MNYTEVQHHGDVAVLFLTRGTTNALNLALINDLLDSLKSVEEEENAGSLVLASDNDKFFSIGFDIPELLSLDREGLKEFYTTFNRLSMELYTLPKPTVAAITGHAIAGGCILTLCCDHRIIAQGRKFTGLNEIKLGLPVPFPADCILRQIVGDRNARNIMEEGEFYLPERSAELGMVDEVVPQEEVMSRAKDKAGVLGAMSREAFGIIKHNRVEDVKSKIMRKLKEREQLFFDCWFSEETQSLIKEAAAKF